METQMEGDILRAVQKYGINVDKEELIRALQYDRNQYEKGYADGKADAMAELVRCKDCEYGIDEEHEGIFSCHASPWGMGGYNKADDFCSYGERRTE
jgi:hypothetical protein